MMVRKSGHADTVSVLDEAESGTEGFVRWVA